MGRVDSDKNNSCTLYSRSLILLLLGVAPVFCPGQTKPQAVRNSSISTMAVARVQVPDVRGRLPQQGQEILRGAGLVPGTTTTKPLPGVAGTVGEQDPPPNSVVVRGTVFNLVLVASNGGQTSDGDEQFSRQVPLLRGLTPDQARILLGRSRLLLGNISAGSGDGAEGKIYSQNPRERSWARIGTKVDVQIVEPPKSPGANPQTIWVFVPDLSGQTQKAADQTLREQGLTLGAVSVEAAPAAAGVGTVFAQFPRPDTRVAQGTAVNLRIAKQGAVPSTIVPDLRGQGVDTASSDLGKVGLQLGQITSDASGETPNTIISQSPNPDTPVERGTTVDITLAKEIPTVSVPDLTQHSTAEAVAILQKFGLQLGNINKSEGDAPSGSIVSQNPREGVQVRAGTAVDVTVSVQVSAQLTVMVDPTNHVTGKPLTFHAHLEPAEKGVKYSFIFGDGQESRLLASSITTHVYKKGGDFLVKGFAITGGKTIASDTVTVTIPYFPWGAALLAASLLTVSAAGFHYYRWKTFQKWMRLVPKTEVGSQQLSVANRGQLDLCVRVRPVQGPYHSEVQRAKEGLERAKTT